jgi:xanthine/uracil permease
MTLAFLIYLIQFLSSLQVLFAVLASVCLATAAVLGVCWSDVSTKDEFNEDGTKRMNARLAKANSYLKRMRFYGGIGLTLVVVAILIPSQRTAYMMAGGYVTQKIAESPAAAEIGNKVLKIINAKLDVMINDELDKLTHTEQKDGKGQVTQ